MRSRTHVLQRRPPRRGEAALSRGPLARARRTRRSCSRMPSRRAAARGRRAPARRPGPAAGLRGRRWSRSGCAATRRAPMSASTRSGSGWRPAPTVRWVVEANVHTATAYHPANGGHPLRIPERRGALGLGLPGGARGGFEVTLTAEGVYDYFCAPHEVAGMVGRIIVGRPGGPGTRPPGEDVPPAARAAFPSVNGSWPRGSSDPREPRPIPPATGRRPRPGAWQGSWRRSSRTGPRCR